MSLRTILDRLKGVRRTGNGWRALCPAHADRNPSLSVGQKNGRVLLHCFAGCTVEAVCAALGIKVKELFSDQRASHKVQPAIVRAAEKHITGLRCRLTPADRERGVTVVLASRENPVPAFARALALAVEGELVQVAFRGGEE